ncbi:sensor histidine kinase [Nonomuraea sp. NPDC050153]|uniref:sensor histidine kinase n=1 Tax=Nonomuraea sp. NPDC050153 TaxID=3364359 RepID=UPI00378EE70A
MVTEQTHRAGRRRRSLAALSRLVRLGDVPVVIMLAWAGWLAVPWSFSGLAQARAAAAAAAAEAEPPPFAAESVRAESAPQAAWGIPAAQHHRLTTVRSTADAAPDVVMPDLVTPDVMRPGLATPGLMAPDSLAAERARIAGAVHDAAGHGLAAIAMQAGIALVTLDDDPEQTRASLRAIRETSATALAQLRAALDGIDPPGADLAGLAGLIDGVRAAGVPVDVEPADFAVPSRLRAAVYGVVRESLTNVLRHAGPTRALVRVGGGPGEFVLEVADRGAGRASAGEGRGLAGMRARVTEAGGHFAAGPREGGGFQVIARFPRVSA